MKPRLYTYIITADNGKSPCYCDGIFTFACCKPQIRRKILKDKIECEKRGTHLPPTYLAGIRRDKKESRARVVFIVDIDEVLKLEEYYDNEKYLKRKDCKYKNVKTIFVDNKLPVTLTKKIIKKACPQIHAEKGTEHGCFSTVNKMSEQHCRDICGGAVLLSSHFDHCNAYEDKWELTDKLEPVLGNILKDYMHKNRRIYHSFDDFESLGKVLKDVKMTTHIGLKGLDEDDYKSCNAKDKKNKQKCKKC
ncbi:MAG: hypothetical protein IK057_00460 [Clostridia bacterium]|nr:hypothetical protein [Clostridia bacterium]